MPSVSLNDVVVRSLAAPSQGQIDYWDKKLPGFGCRVSQRGTKTFVLKHNNRRFTVGRFPLISLADARAEARRIFAEFTLGRLRPQPISFRDAVNVFIDDKAKNRRERTIDDYARHLAKHFPFQGKLTDVTHKDVLARLNRLRSTPAEYNHALMVGKLFFNWCLKRRLVTENPFFGISANAAPARSRVLSLEELRLVWDASFHVGTFGTIVRLLILTGQRRGEISALKGEYIDRAARTITLPAYLTKNGREHAFPYERLASEIFEGIPVHSRPFLLSAPGRQNKFEGWAKGKRELDALCPIAPWCLHDLRRTFATHLAELAVAPHIIERLLNHATGTISGVAAIYNRYSFLEEMRAALNLWETRLQSLIAMQHAA